MTITAVGAEDHIRESLSLESEGYVDLIELVIRAKGRNDVFYLTNTVERTWQGKTWQPFPFSLVGAKRSADEEEARPKFTIVNPSGVFTMFATQGILDNALVMRYGVLKYHLDQNINSYNKNTWRVSRLLSANKQIVSLELRSATDGQNFYLPARQYLPPEFPQVSMN